MRSDEPAPDLASEPGPPTRPRARQALLRWALVALVVGGFVLAVGDRWSDVADRLTSLPATVVLAGGLAVVAGMVGTWWAWWSALSGLGSPMPARPSARVFFVGQLGKYVPGSVWPAVVQMRLGRELGVPRSRMGIAFAVTLGTGVATGLVVGLLALPALLAGTDPALAGVLLLALPAVVALRPRVLNRLLAVALRAARRPVPDTLLSTSAMTRVIAGNAVFWLVGGLHAWLLALALGAPAGRALPAALGGFALAFVVGPLLVVLPAGAGVREAAMTAALTTVLPVADAVAVAVTSRALLMVADGILALGATLLARTGRPGAGMVEGGRSPL